MQATTCFHDGVPTPLLQEADLILHASVALDPTHGMLEPDAARRDPTMRRLLRGREFPATGCFRRLKERAPRLEEALQALLLIQAAARGQAIARFRCQALIGRFAFTGVAEDAKGTRLSAHEEVVERVTLLLATVRLLWRFGSCRAMERTVGTIRPKRGLGDLPSMAGVAHIAANSAAGRAGSRA
jgi:hypothetical protein